MFSQRLLRGAFDSAGAEEVCLKCLRRLAKTPRTLHAGRRSISKASLSPSRTRSRWKTSVSAREYFWPSLASFNAGGIQELAFDPAAVSNRAMSARDYFWPNARVAFTAVLGSRASLPVNRSGSSAIAAQNHDRCTTTPEGIDSANITRQDVVHFRSLPPMTEESSSFHELAVEEIQGIEQSKTIIQDAVASNDPLPHRRRSKRRAEGAQSTESLEAESYVIPPDASSRLTSASTTAPASSWRRKLALYLSLSKPRLTFLIVLTTAAPYCIYPTPDLLSPAITSTPSLSALTLLFLTTGTALSSASANTFNMLFEPKYDAQMSRTRNRPLVRKLISPRAAALFGILTGCAGVAALYFGCNPTTSFLGAANIVLYAGVYTPLKRISVVNTWVGALVGAIPPLMGWTAAAGQYAADGAWGELLLTDQAVGGWLLAALLFAWQFPHFNALSHTIRHEYANAGYKMLCSVNPARNARVALRYSILMFPICYGLAACGIVGGGSVTAPTTVLWAVGSTATNGWMSYQALRFWRWQGAKGTARSLFWASVWHLPVLLVLAMALKRGIWQRMVDSLGLGAPDENLEDDSLALDDTASLVTVDGR